ncbi:MAG: hypothetical protein DMF56_23900 [Acidobacteria bacterium]|nr:MAG: hypothetical protein DMF56_23900 [Acidobacteriota bacterium]
MKAEGRRQKAEVSVVLLSLVVTGCSFFSRTKSNFYSLERIAPTTAVVAARGVPVAIDSIEMPPGFDRKDIVVRKANHQLDVRGTEQWTASLEPMVLHTLAFDLASRLPEGMVILPGQLKPAGMTRSISVVFGEFAAGPDANVTLDARWTLNNVTHAERIELPIASLDSANIADGFSRALAQLADRMAAQLGP